MTILDKDSQITNEGLSFNKSQEGWRKVQFGEVVLQITDRVKDPLGCGLERYIAGGHFEPGSLHLKGWGSLDDGMIGPAFNTRFKAGQMLYVSRNPHLRKAAIAEFDGICANTTYVLEANTTDLLPEFLPFVMQSEEFVDFTIKNKRGSTNPYLNWKDITPYEFLLPPLDEQRRIAEILWAADTAIETAKQAEIIAKKALVLACQQWTFTPKDSDHNEWKNLPISECTIILDNLRKPLNEEERAKIKGNIPYYGANGPIDYIGMFIFDEEIILIGEDGDHFFKWETWPQTHFVKGKSWVNNHAHVLKAKDYFSNEWLYRYFVHRNILEFIQDSASMTRRKLTKASLSSIPVPWWLHGPSAEQFPVPLP